MPYKIAMATDIDDEARRLHAYVATDNPFQRRARVRQARWRERTGLPIGEHRGRLLGSRLPMPFARDTLANYLTDGIRDVVRAEVLDAKKSAGKLYGQPRIFNDLLAVHERAPDLRPIRLLAALVRDEHVEAFGAHWSTSVAAM